MRVFKFLLMMVWVLPVEAGAFTCRDLEDFYQWYSKVDAVVLVKVVGEERKSSGDSLSDALALFNREAPLYNLEVLRSWKKDMPKSLTLPADQVMHIIDKSYPATYPEMGEEIFLYLGKTGRFQNARGGCSSRWGYIDPVQWLDRLTACGCKVFDAQGSHNAADLVVSARVNRITKEGTNTFAEMDYVSILWSKFEHDSQENPRLTVLTEDGRRKECGYPVQQGERYLLYLRRDRENGYSTDICSGNLAVGQQGYNIRVMFEKEQPKPSE